MANKNAQLQSSEKTDAVSLPLVGHSDGLALLAQRHAGGVLLGADGARLALVLDEGDAFSSGHDPHFPETLEPAEQRRQRLDRVVVRQVPHEQDLVRRQVLVGHDRGGGRVRRLEPRSLDRLRRSTGHGGVGNGAGDSSRSLELLLRLEGFLGLLPL